MDPQICKRFPKKSSDSFGNEGSRIALESSNEIETVPSLAFWISNQPEFKEEQQLQENGLLAMPSSSSAVRLKQIGEGAWGVVYALGQNAVVKIVPIELRSTCVETYYEGLIPRNLQQTCKLTTTTTKAADAGYCNHVVVPLEPTRLLYLSDEDQYVAAIKMPFVDGGNASDFFGIGTPQFYEMVRWTAPTLILDVESLFSVVASLHGDLHTLHCDLKPENFLVEQSSRMLYLSDFGVVCAVERNQSNAHLGLCSKEPIQGDPRYFPYFMLESQHNSAASDVYSLCISFVEMVIGIPYNQPSWETIMLAAVNLPPHSTVQLPDEDDYNGEMITITDEDLKTRAKSVFITQSWRFIHRINSVYISTNKSSESKSDNDSNPATTDLGNAVAVANAAVGIILGSFPFQEHSKRRPVAKDFTDLSAVPWAKEPQLLHLYNWVTVKPLALNSKPSELAQLFLDIDTFYKN